MKATQPIRTISRRALLQKAELMTRMTVDLRRWHKSALPPNRYLSLNIGQRDRKGQVLQLIGEGLG